MSIKSRENINYWVLAFCPENSTWISIEFELNCASSSPLFHLCFFSPTFSDLLPSERAGTKTYVLFQFQWHLMLGQIFYCFFKFKIKLNPKEAQMSWIVLSNRKLLANIKCNEVLMALAIRRVTFQKCPTNTKPWITRDHSILSLVPINVEYKLRFLQKPRISEGKYRE